MDLVLMLTQKCESVSAATDRSEMTIVSVMYFTKVTNALLMLQKQFTLGKQTFLLTYADCFRSNQPGTSIELELITFRAGILNSPGRSKKT